MLKSDSRVMTKAEALLLLFVNNESAMAIVWARRSSLFFVYYINFATEPEASTSHLSIVSRIVELTFASRCI